MKKEALLLALLLFLVIVPADAHCATCRAVLESEEGNQSAKGINNGIIYLMVFPYLLVGGIGYAIYKMRQRAKSAEN